MKQRIATARDRFALVFRRMLSRLHTAPRTRTFRISLIVVAIIGLAAAWMPLLTGNRVDESDSKAVAGKYLAYIQENKPNHAYQLQSKAFKDENSEADFRSKVAPAMTKSWPNYPAHYVGSTTPDKNDKNVTMEHFGVASDGVERSRRVSIRLVRDNESAPWRVDTISSMANIYRVPKRGEM